MRVVIGEFNRLLILLSVAFMLIPSHKESILVRFFGNNEEFTSINLLIQAFLYSIVFVISFISSNKRLSLTNVLVVALLTVSLMVSLFIFSIRFDTLTGLGTLLYMPLFYLFLLENLKEITFSNRQRNLVFMALYLWCIYPLFNAVLFNNWLDYIGLATDVNSTDLSFSGFAIHRNVYGYFCALTGVLILTSRLTRNWKVTLLVTIFVAVTLSQSRTAIAVLILLSIAYVWSTHKNYRFGIMILAASGLMILVRVFAYLKEEMGTRDLMESDESRLFIISKLWIKYKDTIIFGSGETSFIDIGLEVPATAHNFIVQTVLDFGVFNLAFFIILITVIFQKCNFESRLIFLCIILFGLTQPYFSFGVPNGFMYLAFSLMLINNGINTKHSK